MKRHGILKLWNFSFKAFFVMFVFNIMSGQNSVSKMIDADGVSTININGNQIFNIEVIASESYHISYTSIVDGEYENDFQIISKITKGRLEFKLEQYKYTNISDDKRNAHKVVAAKLVLNIPEHLNLNIVSDIANLDIKGSFNTINVRLEEGICNFNGNVNKATINTFNGNINVITNNKSVYAVSNNGIVDIHSLEISKSNITLKSINGNISVIKPN